MRTLIVALALAVHAPIAMANCTTYTRYVDGQLVVCQVCCSGGVCHTAVCF